MVGHDYCVKHHLCGSHEIRTLASLELIKHVLHCAGLTSALREAGIIKGWRDELYPVTRAFHDAPLAVIERAAAPHFGIKVSSGSHAPS